MKVEYQLQSDTQFVYVADITYSQMGPPWRFLTSYFINGYIDKAFGVRLSANARGVPDQKNTPGRSEPNTYLYSLRRVYSRLRYYQVR